MMNLIKISVLLRSPSVLWDYKRTNERDFWQDLSEQLLNKLPVAPVQKCNGSFQHLFFLATDKDADALQALTCGILDDLITDADAREMLSVVAVTPTAEELADLKKNVDEAENAAFWAEASKLSESTDTPPAADTDTDAAKPLSQSVQSLLDRLLGNDDDGDGNEDDESEGPDTDSDDDDVLDLDTDPDDQDAETDTAAVTPNPRTTTEIPKEKKQTENPRTLLQQVQRLQDLKCGLLQKIRGQRHAVDEVVQSIFECEMFSSHNKARKGPLATFLFTGPSGVGKTFLAEQCGALLDRPMLVVDMSEYSDNLANNKFNGEHGQPAVVTQFVRKNPNGIIVFDEVEKAHINTIHLFLQILDAGRLMDHKVKKEVSFRDNIIIMTTNAGKSLYEDTTVCDLSATPRNVILDALRSDVNTHTGEAFFPECITTRMANGHMILFNHLEPFALTEIVRDEIALQMRLFEESSGIKVEYDPKVLSALVLYNGGGVSDARTLRGLARGIVVRELQEVVMQLLAQDPARVQELKRITLCVDTEESEAVGSLFVNRERLYVGVFTENAADRFAAEGDRRNTTFEITADSDVFKRCLRGVVDYVLIDPLCGVNRTDRLPNDIEDVDSSGMQMFRYTREFSPETPIYILDTSEGESRSFDSLLAAGARGVIKAGGAEAADFSAALETLTFSALINNAVYSLGRSGKYLAFNCAQYITDATQAVISFEKLQIKSAPLSGDSTAIARKGENNNLKFSDLVGCRTAKETLGEYCKALDNPREVSLSGKRMPKGVLLYGPPGTGKTMLAKAMANECNATFFPISATSFFGPHVGETEQNVRDIFKKARRYAPSIIFVDEVDAIGRRRSGSASTSHNEDALNTFLAEMDGFVHDERRPVFIMAATNYDLEGDSGRVLDPAFVRRFDSKLLIPLPDTDDRYELLAMCLRKHSIHFGEDHDKILRNMAERTGGMSNADIEMMNAQFVRSLGTDEPTREKYMDTLDAFRFGEVNKMDKDHLRQTACHEAGHALVCRLCGVTPSFLTVVSRGDFGGFMESAGENKTGTYTYQQLLNRVCRSLAGRVAEIEVYGEEAGTNTGASSDIKNARYFIRACLNDFAMGENLYAQRGLTEPEALMRAQYERTQKMIREHRETLDRLTDLLAQKKSLDQNQMEAFFAAEGI